VRWRTEVRETQVTACKTQLLEKTAAIFGANALSAKTIYRRWIELIFARWLAAFHISSRGRQGKTEKELVQVRNAGEPIPPESLGIRTVLATFPSRQPKWPRVGSAHLLAACQISRTAVRYGTG